MKRIHNYLLTVIAVFTFSALLSSCGNEDGPTDREVFIENMTGTWEVTEESTIILNDQDITDVFIGFVISIDSDLTFTTNSDELTITEFPWPTEGSFLLNYELTMLTRNDGLRIDISIDDTTNELTLDFEAESGRAAGIGGGWRCRFRRR